MSAIENFKNSFAGMEFVAVSSWVHQDEDGYCTGQRSSRDANDVTLDEIIKLFSPSRGDDWTLEQYIEDNKIYDLKALCNAWSECNDNEGSWSHLFEKNDYLLQKSEKQRKELETAAVNFAAKHKTGGVNLVFIQKIEEELQNIREDEEQWNSGECRAERYARSTPESFASDSDYVSGKLYAKSSHLNQILNWVQSNCPLLWAKYEETLTGVQNA